MYLGPRNIDDLLTFPANTHAVDTGVGTDADSVPTYRVYEDETGTAILTGSMAKLDDANTVGFYSEQITLSSANGFEDDKSYTIYIAATVDSIAATMSHSFNVVPAYATAAALATAQTDLDTITGSDGVTLATAQANYAPGTAAELAKVPKSDGTTSWNATALAAINAEADTALTDYDPPTKAELDSGLAALNDLDAAGVATAVWNAATVTYGGAGTYGQAVEDVLVDTAEIGTAGAGLTNINLPDQTMNITGNITGNLSGSVGSVTGAVGSVTGAVGSVTGAVGSVAGNVDGNVTGSVGSVTGHTAQTGDTYALAAGATGFTAIDTVVDAVKVKTDQMVFTKANELDANTQSINGAAVVGDGNATPWDGA